VKTTLHTNRLHRYRTLFIFTLIAIVVYLVWRTFFSLPLKYGVVAFIFGLFLLIAEYFASFEAVVNYTMLSEFTPPEMPNIPIDWYPHVDICIATHNETVDMLYTTINGCKFLDYPDKSKVHIHLCDDNARPEMEQLAKEFGIHYWGISNNRDAKGGNLNNAIRQTYAPIVVTLDADMIPRHEFLMKTVPYFFLPKMKKDQEGNWIPKTPDEIDPNEKIGFVQTPQGFYNPDLFQYNLYSENKVPGEQDYFFREINVARSVKNATIYAGSNTLISREALEDVDYIAVDTITEDILTGMRIQKLGYKTIATSELLVQGQAPISIKGLLSQRERWGRGCIDTMRQEAVVFSGRMTFAQKVNYLTAWIFWWLYAGRAVFIAAPIVVILFNLPIVHAEMWQVFVWRAPQSLNQFQS
jgi:cellulose synthase (UDP-forming)